MNARIILFACFATASTFVAFGPAAAQGTKFSYVSGTATFGSSNCSLAAPFQYVDDAVRIGTPNGVVTCIDAPLSGAINITKAVTINCPFAGIGPLNNGGADPAAITIDIPSGSQIRTVRLNGLIIENGNQANPVTAYGIVIKSAGAVFVENVRIQSSLRGGIYDARAGGGSRLFVKDSIINNNNGPGVIVAGVATSMAVLDNVSLYNNTYGIVVAGGNNVFVNRSVISGNSVAGVEADGNAKVAVDQSTINNNSIGVQAFGTIRLSNSNVAYNSTAFQGAVTSLGGNRVSGNSTVGAVPSQAGGVADVLVP